MENIDTEESKENPTETTNSKDENTTKEQIIELTESEYNKLLKDVEDAKGDFLRERADFINYRKRSAQEKLDLEPKITGKILEQLIPALDGFDQLFSIKVETSSANDGGVALTKFIDGAVLIKKQFMDTFSNLGVTEFNPINSVFDPNTMEGLHIQESDDVTEPTVQSVFQKGYKMKDKVIRPARVAILQPKAKEKTEEQQ